MKIAVIGRSDKTPSLEMFAKGAHRTGALVEIVDVLGERSVKLPENTDLAVLQGGPYRYRKIYEPVIKKLGKRNTVITEPSPFQHPGGAGRFYLGLGGHFWAPKKDSDPHRASELGFVARPQDLRGASVLIIGQGPRFVAWMKENLPDLRRKCPTRRFVWRPHPQHTNLDPGYHDSVSYPEDSSLGADLRAAHCAITHSSAAGLTALMLGVPVFCAKGCGYSSLCAKELSVNMEPPDQLAVQGFLDRYSLSIWSADEVASGRPFKILLEERRRV